MAGNLWKASSEHGGNLAVLTTSNWGDTIYILDGKTGALIDTGKFDKTYEDGRSIYRFNNPGRNYNNVVVLNVNTGEHFYISNGASRYDNLQTSTAKNNGDEWRKDHPDAWQFDPATFQTTQTGDITPSTDSNVPGIEGVGNVSKPILMSMEGFEFKDPIEKMRALAKENNGIIDENFIKSLADANVLSKADQNQLLDYLNTMSPFQMQMVGIENAFNQKQKLQAAETAQPGITDLLRGEVKNAQTLASGRLLRDAEDRALEQTARSAGADAAWTRGLGDDSLVGKRLSDQLSVSQRLGLMQQGQNYMNTAVQLANQTLMDTPNKAALSQQISGTPQKTISDITSQQWQIWNNGTTMSPESAQGSIVQQRTNQADLDKSLQSEFNKYMYDIMAANTQAINTQNQDIINDQANTAASERRSLAYQQAALAFANGLVDKGEYEQILAQIEQTGTVDLSTWSDEWKDWYDNYLNADKEERDKERDRLARENSDINSGRVPSKPEDNTQNGTGGSAGEVGGGNDTIYRDKPAQQEQQQRQENTPNNKFLLINSNGQSSKIIDNSGYINLPERNQNFNYNMSYWEYINTEIDDTDLSGVF